MDFVCAKDKCVHKGDQTRVMTKNVVVEMQENNVQNQ